MKSRFFIQMIINDQIMPSSMEWREVQDWEDWLHRMTLAIEITAKDPRRICRFVEVEQ